MNLEQLEYEHKIIYLLRGYFYTQVSTEYWDRYESGLDAKLAEVDNEIKIIYGFL